MPIKKLKSAPPSISDLNTLKTIWTEIEKQIKKGNQQNAKIKEETESEAQFKLEQKKEDRQAEKSNELGEEED